MCGLVMGNLRPLDSTVLVSWLSNDVAGSRCASAARFCGGAGVPTASPGPSAASRKALESREVTKSKLPCGHECESAWIFSRSNSQLPSRSFSTFVHERMLPAGSRYGDSGNVECRAASWNPQFGDRALKHSQVQDLRKDLGSSLRDLTDEAGIEATQARVSSDVFVPRTQTAEELQDAFGCQGLRFWKEAGGAVAAELKLRNGSRARVLLPRAQIVSYKPHMWHGGEEEWLYASSSRSRSQSRDGGGKFSPESVTGGIDLRFGDSQVGSERWTIEGADCDPAKYAQITLSCSSIRPVESVHGGQGGGLQGRYVVTLTDHYLSSALVLTNIGLPSVEFTCSIATHLAVRTLEGAMAIGLKGERLYSRSGSPAPTGRPSKFTAALGNVFSRALGGFMGAKPDGESGDSDSESRADEDANPALDNGGGYWAVESEDYSELRGGDDRVYPSPPSTFTILDRGLRRSLRVERLGFREFFLSNPGPASKLANWNNFVCLGPAETMTAVRLAENEQWQGAQVLWNTGSD